MTNRLHDPDIDESDNPSNGWRHPQGVTREQQGWDEAAYQRDLVDTQAEQDESTQTPTGPQTFEIPVDNMNWLQRKLDQMNKRAAKLGCPPVYVTSLGNKLVPHRLDPSDPDSAIVYYEYVLVQVTGAAPVLPGWTLVAALQHVEGHTLVRTAPEQTLPTEYRGAAPWCDHCQTRRQRQETFVLRNADGRLVQIGRNCLRDFLTGGHGPEALAFWATLERQIQDAAEEASEPGQRQRWVLHLNEYLPMVAACMRTHGWVSATLAKSDPDRLTSTSSEAMNQLLSGHRLQAENRVEVLPEDAARALAATEWAKTLPESSSEDYLNNLGIIARLGTVPERMSGVAASMIAAYERAQGIERERRERKPSNHVGTIGKREVFQHLTCVSIKDVAGQFGVTYLHMFQDEQGNQLKWWSSSEKLWTDKVYDIKATVKAFEEFRGIKQTTITRCVAQEVK